MSQLPPQLFDTHCHLNLDQFEADRAEVIARARDNGVTQFVVVGCDLVSSRRAVELARPEEGLFASAGIHPHAAREWSPHAERELRGLLSRPGVVALGEIGLDFYRDLSPREAQAAAFAGQMELALELNLPIIVHTRDSMEETLVAASAFAGRGLRGVFHCWSGTLEQALRATADGWMVGVGGVLTYPKPGELPTVVRELPLETIVLETDAPYLPPAPHRGRRNEPGYLRIITERVAEERGVGIDDAARATSRNARRLFRL